MRIELLGGSGSVAAMKSSLDNLYDSISDSIRELASTEDKVHNLLKNESSSYLFKTVQGLQNRIETENNKRNAVALLRNRAEQFISNTVETDHQIALLVSTNEKLFFEKYPALKPHEESLLDRLANVWADFKEGWNEFWGTIGDAISAAVDAVVDFIKEHWVEILVGTVFIVLGAALTAFTGGLGVAFLGTFLSALAKGFVFAATQAVIGGIISAGIAAVFGGDVWAAFGDGLASGYMWGGIFFFVSSAVTAIRTAVAARKAAKAKVSKVGKGTQPTQKKYKFANEESAKNHLTRGDGIGDKGQISGAHNADDFWRTLPDNYKVVSETPQSVDGVRLVEYRIPAKTRGGIGYQYDLNGNIVYKSGSAYKTIYDPKVISDKKMFQWAKEAMENSHLDGRYLMGESHGIKFVGYLENNNITNVSPRMP